MLPVHSAKHFYLMQHICSDYCIEQNCDYLFYVDGDVHFTNPKVIQLLIAHNRLVTFYTFRCFCVEPYQNLATDIVSFPQICARSEGEGVI